MVLKFWFRRFLTVTLRYLSEKLVGMIHLCVEERVKEGNGRTFVFRAPSLPTYKACK